MKNGKKGNMVGFCRDFLSCYAFLRMKEMFEPVPVRKRLWNEWKEPMLKNPDPLVQRELWAKRDDYFSRLGSKNPRYVKDAKYKILVLEKLLADGVVNPNELVEELAEKDEDFDPDLLRNAIHVIWERNQATSTEGERHEKEQRIELSTNSSIQEQLRMQLSVYRARLKGVDPKEVFEGSDAFYKWRVLNQLLKYDSLDPGEYKEELLEESPEKFDEDLYENAVGVIRIYNKEGAFKK
jgi:hypothetical protein